jgi:hypothetical protein
MVLMAFLLMIDLGELRTVARATMGELCDAILNGELCDAESILVVINLGMINCAVFCVPCILIIISIALFIAQA